MHPILNELKININKLEGIEKDLIRTHSKFWRLQDKYFKLFRSLNQSLTTFSTYIERSVLNEKTQERTVNDTTKTMLGGYNSKKVQDV